MIHFSLRQLEYFVAAAHHENGARAAKALGISQPSISNAIAELEGLWGEQLFVRLHARGLELTAAGMSRFRMAQTLLRQAEALVVPRSEALQGQLRVGCLTTLGPRYMPEVLTRMRKEYPGIELHVEEGDTEVLTRQLERGAMDVALMYDLGLARGVSLEAVTDLWPYALLPWGHPLAGRGQLRLAELASEPFILINLPHSRTYFLSLFHSAGITPTISYESPSIEMIRAMVANGLGVSILTTRPQRDVSYDGKRLACRVLRGKHQPQTVALAHPAEGHQQSHLMEAFAMTVRATFSSLSNSHKPERA